MNLGKSFSFFQEEESATVVPTNGNGGSGGVHSNEMGWKGTEEEEETLSLMQGEKILFSVKDKVAVQLVFSNPWHDGFLYITNYQIIFRNENSTSLNILVPLMLIESLKRKSITTESHEMKMKLKDLRQLRIKFQGREMEKIYNMLCGYLQINSADQKLFAFHFKLFISEKFQGWKVFDCIEEYQRMNIPNGDWKISSINAEYLLCATYPKYICVPTSIKGAELMCISAYRSGGRIPVLVWKEVNGNAGILRCAQPLTGLTGNRCVEDEKLISLALRASGSNQIHIVDCRPYKNAVANQMKGGGYENSIYYENSSISWAGMANIHGVYDSWSRLFLLLNRQHSTATSGWFGALESTNWMTHIFQSLETTKIVVDHISLGHSVVVHCSDGWDRTPTILSLSQLCLDPYYRTLQGFIVLIEKDWISFGHRFGDRCGRQPSSSNLKKGAANSTDSKVVSSSKAYGFTPIFLLFMDSVHQIMEQFPLHFEFNELLLMKIMDAVYSCQFGTFLTNCEKEQNQIENSTVSFWTTVIANPTPFLNPLYFKLHSNYFRDQKMKTVPETTSYEKKNQNFGNERLMIDPSSKHIRFWSSYFLRGWTSSDIQLVLPTLDTHFLSSRKQRVSVQLKSNPLETKKSFTQLAHSIIEEKENTIKSLLAKINQLEQELGPKSFMKEIVLSIVENMFDSSSSNKSAEIDIEEEQEFSVESRRKSVDHSSHSSFHYSKQENAFRLCKPPEWVPDQIALCCKICQCEFTSFRRKHHCRNCGCVFCATCCSNKRMIERLGFVRPVRVCNNCVDHIDHQISPANSPNRYYNHLHS